MCRFIVAFLFTLLTSSLTVAWAGSPGCAGLHRPVW